MTKKPEDSPTSRQQLGILLKPSNLVKTVGSIAPFSSPFVEMQNQLEGAKVDRRLTRVEGDLHSLSERHKLEQSASTAPLQVQDWPFSASEYFRRSCDIAVVYDGGIHSKRQSGHELILPVCHACLIGNNEALTCKEALQTAKAVATYKHGRMVIISGGAWHDFEAEEPDKLAGLSVCKLSPKDEKRWSEFSQILTGHGLPAPVENLPGVVRSSVMPWVGQEVAFLHSGEAEDATIDLGSYSPLQFDSTTVSHFRRLETDAVKTFVTGVLPGRVTRAGAGVFSRDGTLLGIFSDTESLKSDAGRRGVVRSLLGHPRFTVLGKVSSSG